MLTSRREQMFPELTPPEMERMARFGTPRQYRAGEYLENFLRRNGEPYRLVCRLASLGVTRAA